MAIHVSIIGGGVVGFCVAHSLLQHPDITFDIYEKRDSIRVIGQGLMLQNTARQSLRLIDGDVGLIPEQTGGAEIPSWTVAMGEGPYRGQLSYKMHYPEGQSGIGVDRTKFISELQKKVPDERLHLNKRVVAVDEAANSSKRYTIHFEDGTTVPTDAIIGADGLRSYIRQLVLKDIPAERLVPQPSGLWDGRLRVPTARARALLTAHTSQSLTEGSIMLVGIKGNIYFSLLDIAEFATCIVAGWKEQTESSPWRFPLTKDFLDENFGDDGWGELGRGVKEMILEQTQPEGFFEWDVHPFPTFHRGRMCLVGDAAHSAVPWLAAGASIGIEDAAILGKLLKQVHSVSDLDAVFSTFTKVQLERSHTLIKNSRQTARNMVEGANTSPEELARNDRVLKDFLLNVDMKERVDAALSTFEEERAALRGMTT